MQGNNWGICVHASLLNMLNLCFVYRVDVIIKRVGGAYGGKISRASLIAAGCGLGAYVTRRCDHKPILQLQFYHFRPVRMHMDIDTNMRMIGKRFPYYAKYSVSTGQKFGATH